jgi:hypothetical protein
MGDIEVTPIADMVASLLEQGATPEMIVMAVRGAELSARKSGGIPVDAAAEKRRAWDRERKRKSGGIPVESGGIPQKALTLTSLTNKKEKKVRAAKHPIPPDWKPSEFHFQKAAELHIPRSAVEAKAEDMRIWAGSTAALKADWDLTFHGFLRRDAPKLAVMPRAGPMLTITPADRSWNAWKSHFRDAGQNGRAAIMDKCASDGKPFTVQSEWPPGMAA